MVWGQWDALHGTDTALVVRGRRLFRCGLEQEGPHEWPPTGVQPRACHYARHGLKAIPCVRLTDRPPQVVWPLAFNEHQKSIL